MLLLLIGAMSMHLLKFSNKSSSVCLSVGAVHLQVCGSGDLHCSKGSHPGLQLASVTRDGAGVGLFS